MNPNDVELFNFNGKNLDYLENSFLNSKRFNFKEKSFVNYTSRQFFSGNLKNIDLLYKERFKKDLFKEVCHNYA